jgi:hypothetical protein
MIKTVVFAWPRTYPICLTKSSTPGISIATAAWSQVAASFGFASNVRSGVGSLKITLDYLWHAWIGLLREKKGYARVLFLWRCVVADTTVVYPPPPFVAQVILLCFREGMVAANKIVDEPRPSMA